MDILAIIVNDNKNRKKVKAYLKSINLGGFIAVPSIGTSDILENYSTFRAGTESTLNRMSSTHLEGKTIFVLNKEAEKTQSILDEVAKIFEQDSKKSNSGIAFSIPLNSLIS